MSIFRAATISAALWLACCQPVRVSVTTATTSEVSTVAPTLFTVVLGSPPISNVIVPLSTTDGTEGTVSPSSFVFTPGFWNIAQTATIKGADDFIDDGDMPYSIRVGPVASADPAFNAFNPPDITVTNTDDDTAAINVSPTTGLITTEAGGTATFTVSLASQPTGTGIGSVVIGLTSSDTTEGTMFPASLTFTTGNWATPQVVTVRGVNDDVADGPVVYQVVTAAAVATDPNYNGFNAADVSVTNTDDDVVGVTVSPAGPLTTTEAGAQASFTIVLDSEPTGTVSIPITSDTTAEGVVSASSVSFTVATWSTVQTVTVTGVDDNIDDDNVNYNIVCGAAVSTDAAYNGFDPADVTAVNIDDDTAGITVSPTSGLQTAEDGTSAVFTLVLRSEPTADVTFTVTSGDTTEGDVPTGTYTFTSTTWNVAQSVTVVGQDDNVVDGTVSYSITLVSASTDAKYALITSTLPASNLDDDVAGIVVTPTNIVTTEMGGTQSFTILLRSEPISAVVLDVVSGDTTEGTVDRPQVTFTAMDWNVAQVITVTAVDDLIADGAVTYPITIGPATSTDAIYSNMPAPGVLVTNTDDDVASIVVTAASTVTSEAGQTAVITFVLNSECTSDVVVSVQSSNPAEATVLPSTVTFTPATWSTAVTVTVTGVDDFIDDGDVAYIVSVGPAVSSDTSYSGIVAADVQLTNTDDDVAGVTVNPTMGLITTEQGGQASFTIVLDTQPVGGQVLILMTTDSTEGTLSADSVSFTFSNWATPQVVTVRGVNDDVADGPVVYQVVTAAAVATDPNYNGFNAADVSVTNTDDDVVGVTVSPAGPLTTTEAGAQASFTIVLDSEPTGTVSIPITSDTTAEGVVSASSVSFTVATWSTVQTVTVTGVDDNIDDDNVNYNIVCGAAVSTDAAYNGFDPADVTAVNIDDDTAGITVSPTSGLQTAEDGTSAVFTLVLRSEPTADVTFTVTSGDTTEGDVPTGTYTFTSTTWNVAQSVTVVGQDDNVVDGTVSYSISCSVTATGDTRYQGLSSTVTVSNRDNDVAGVLVTPTVLAISETTSQTADFRLTLESEPTADVSFSIRSSDTSESTVAPGTVTFTAVTWNVPQVVTVTAVDDQMDDGDVLHSIIVDVGTSLDPAYNGMDPQDVQVTTLDDDTKGVTVFPTSGLQTNEGGQMAEFTVLLTSQPVGDVSVTFSAAAEVSASPATLLFLPSTWGFAQTVTLTGIDDNIADGDVSVTVTAAPIVSSDTNYNGFVAPSVTVTNLDDDVPGVSTTAGTDVTTELGGWAFFTVRLLSQPTANVIVPLSSSDPTEGVPDVSSLIFTAATWSILQTVTVTGVNDQAADGDQMYTINIEKCVTSDARYSALSSSSMSMTNTDDDVIGVTVTPVMGSTTENGGLMTFTVVLSSMPSALVTVPVSVSDATEGSVSVASISFSGSSYAIPQTVTVTGLDDFVADGDVAYSVVLAPATSSDVQYSGFDPSDIQVINTDDDVASLVVTPTSGLVTSKAGGGATFTVALGSQPTASATVPISSSNTAEGVVAVSSLTFTTANWNQLQTVTVSGVDDHVDDGNVVFNVVVGPPTSSDAAFSALSAVQVGVTNLDDDTAGIVATASPSLVTTEAGGMSYVYISLSSMPANDVSISVASTDTSEGTVSTNSVHFTPATWSVIQTVTVTGVNDDVADGDVQYTVMLSPAVSADMKYASIDPQDFLITNTDNDAVGVTLSATQLTTSEAQTSATFTAVLNSEPTADVLMAMTSSDITEGSVMPPSLSFSSATWSVPQTVTVVGVEDFVADGDITYNVRLGASSADANYNSRIFEVSATNTDDDTVGYTVTQMQSTTSEAGNTATVEFSLTSEPIAAVIIMLTSSNPQEGTLSTATLTFTSASWNVPQTLTVQGVDDEIADGDVTYSVVTRSTASQDTNYALLDPQDLTFVNIDDDVSGIDVAPLSGLTTAEDGTSATFTVALRSQPELVVSIPITSQDSTEGRPATSMLQFTPSNWKAVQTVTVIGVDDFVADGDTTYTMTVGTALNYYSINPPDVVLTNTDNDVAGVVVTTSATTLTEAGTQAFITMVLSSQPLDTVTVPVSSSDTTEATVSHVSMVFQPSSWNTVQTLTVTAVDDKVADGDQNINLVLAAVVSSDAAYSGTVLQDIALTVVDDDVSGVLLSLVSQSSTTSETGTSVSLSLVLQSQPTADVIVQIASSNAQEGTPLPLSATFTVLTWSTPQPIVVTGVDDKLDDGNVGYSVSGTAMSADAVYQGAASVFIQLTNENDDTAGITVAPTTMLTTSEGGDTATFTMVLNSEPSSAVVVSLSSSDTTEGALSPTSLTYDFSDWSIPKTVTVTGQPDTVDDGAVTYEVIFSPAASMDMNYHGTVIANIPVTNEALHCSQFLCPADKIPQNVHCTGSSCTEPQCCISSCASHTCVTPRVPVASPNMVPCPSGCTDTICCEYSCTGHSCPIGTVVRDATCPSSTCTDNICCGESCSTFTCLSGFLIKAAAATLGCPAGGCDNGFCCEQSCDSYQCPMNYKLKTSADNIRCLTGCNVNMCCDITCNSYVCPTHLALLPNALTISCDSNGCSTAKCCFDRCAGVVCTATSVCRNPGTCDPTSGQCRGDPPKVDGTACDDGDASTTNDICSSGTCVGGILCGANVCTPSEPQCFLSACSGNTCTEKQKPDGTACNDGDTATVSDVCTNGKCAGEWPRCSTFSSAQCTLKTDSATIVCPSGTCDTATCCSTCTDFDVMLCPSQQLTNSLCQSGGCDALTCCKDLCKGVACAASDSCHQVGTCDSATGFCTDPVVQDGTVCDDGNAETRSDVCTSGVCSGTCVGTNCAAAEPSCNVPVCTGACTQLPKPDGTVCNDGNVRTVGDRCSSGRCGGAIITCGTSPLAMTCDLITGAAGRQCRAKECSSAECCNSCATYSGTCQAGYIADTSANIYCPQSGCSAVLCCKPDKCAGVTCSGEGQCTFSGVCDPLTGICNVANKADGVACNDGDDSTAGDRCIAGVCVGDATLVDIGSKFVVETPFDTLTATRTASQGLLTALQNHLRAAVIGIRRIKIQSVCRVDGTGTRVVASCIPGTAVVSTTKRRATTLAAGDTFVHLTAAVPSVSLAMATADVQQATKPGTQVGQYRIIPPEAPITTGLCAAVACDVKGQCHDSVECRTSTGKCAESYVADGTTCDDSEAGTSMDTCVLGACSGIITCSGVSCAPINPQCYTAACTADSKCSQVLKADGTPCNDNNPNTVDDRCNRGVCRGTDRCLNVVCAAADCRLAGVCDPATGLCSSPLAPDNTICDDGDAATGGDKCIAGTCVGSISCGTETCVPLEPLCHTAACENDVCTQKTKVNWSPCDDGEPITVDDHCMAGSCVGADKCAGVTCDNADQCHDTGYCLPTTGICTMSQRQDGYPCDDGDPTTTGDKCIRGLCLGSVSCKAGTCQLSDSQCHTAGCDAINGQCIEISKADGTVCTDSNLDTTNDKCVNGNCVGTNLCLNVLCKASDVCHDIGVCDPTLGICSDPQKSYGTACDDGDASTGGDKCINGVCIGSIVCGGNVCMPSLAQCQAAACVGSSCVSISKTGPCNDENMLTLDDQCTNGQCRGVDRCAGVTCSASDDCHALGTCNPITGLCNDPVLSDGSQCNDGDVNTVGDRCVGGVCVGEVACGSTVCTPSLPKCNVASCDGTQCVERAKPDGSGCNDGDPATVNDRCIGGACTGALSCQGSLCLPSDPQCHVALCDQDRCMQKVKPDGTPCTDGLTETTDDRCAVGICTGKNKCSGVVCTASDSCHMQGSCNPLTGLCSDPLKADGVVCDDGDTETSNDKCVSGVCVGSISCGGGLCIPLSPGCYKATCVTNQCSQAAMPTGTPCNDGNALTRNDVCSLGKCGGTDLCSGVVCEVASQCHNVGVCNSQTGICSDPIKPDGAICDDEVAYTGDDVCTAGVCAGSILCGGSPCKVDSPQCQLPTCNQGTCSFLNKPDGTVCNDGDINTGSDSCLGGRCVGSDRCQGVTCTAMSQCHNVGACISSRGSCTQPRKTDGTSCDDGSLLGTGQCTAGQCLSKVTCRNEVCAAVEPQCHNAVCYADGCGLLTKSDGTLCDDGDDRTAGDRCMGGGCSGSVTCNNTVCSSSSPMCHVPKCSNNVCIQVPKPDGTPCDDGNQQTTDDNCQGGTCAGTDKCASVVCTPSSMCVEKSSCNPKTGLCVEEHKVAGVACDDGDAATKQDACHFGVCAGVPTCSGVVCTPTTLPCLQTVCLNNRCDEQHKPDGITCDDGNPDTQEDKCQGGACVGWVSCGGICTPSDPWCGTAACVDGKCVQKPKTDGATCHDGVPDTVNDVCSNGVCEGENLCAGKVCVASDGCHDNGVCISHLGICSNVVKTDGASCNDGLADTTGDKCLAGACAGTLSCNGSPCTPTEPHCFIAVCTNNVCTQVAKDDGTACNDNDLTTMNDKCVNGACAGESRCAGVTCPAADSCHTAGTCTPELGICTSPPVPDGTTCDDGDAVTSDDKCVSGVCVGSIACGGATCTTSAKCSTVTCTMNRCAEEVRADGLRCNDGNYSTVNDMCTAGVCKGTVDYCIPNLCGPSQDCTSGTGPNMMYTCACKAPLVGSATNTPATCRAIGKGECENVGTCKSAGQVCVDPSANNGNWMCVCNPPLRGAAADAAATCSVMDTDPQVAHVTISPPVQAQQWGVLLADRLGINPSRVVVEQGSAAGELKVSFHGPPDPNSGSTIYGNNHLAVANIFSEFMVQAAACPADGFCSAMSIASVDYAAMECSNLPTEQVCGKKGGCSWGDKCSSSDDSKDFVWHLRWVLPVLLFFIVLLCVGLFLLYKRRQQAIPMEKLPSDAPSSDKGEKTPSMVPLESDPVKPNPLEHSPGSMLSPEVLSQMRSRAYNPDNAPAQELSAHTVTPTRSPTYSPMMGHRENSLPPWVTLSKETDRPLYPEDYTHSPDMHTAGRGAAAPPAPSGRYPVKI